MIATARNESNGQIVYAEVDPGGVKAFKATFDYAGYLTET